MKNKQLIDITKKTGKIPGKTIAIFAGVHGDEKAGIMTLEYLNKELSVEAGTVYLVYANEQAVKENKRFIKTNLNRLFIRTGKDATCYEEVRANELMDILDSCDALLDLHSYNEPSGEAVPFAICEPDCQDIVKNFNVPIVIDGFDAIEEGGSDGYMYNNNKYGICVELGAIESPEKFLELGINTAYQFMQYFGCVSNKVAKNTVKQTCMHASSIYKKRDDVFSFNKKYKTFDQIDKNEVIAQDGTRDVLAKEDGFILFPRAEHPVGTEVFIVATPSSSS